MTRLWKNAFISVLAGTFALLSPLSAEELAMPAPPALQDDGMSQSVTLPGRGMTMVAVEERFGSPRQKFDEVGDPPITRWVYPDFTVYFEYQYVINAVAHNEVAAPDDAQ